MELNACCWPNVQANPVAASEHPLQFIVHRSSFIVHRSSFIVHAAATTQHSVSRHGSTDDAPAAGAT